MVTAAALAPTVIAVVGTIGGIVIGWFLQTITMRSTRKTALEDEANRQAALDRRDREAW
jgi:hypothetical protein